MKIIENWLKSRNNLLGDNAQMEIISSDNMTVCRFYIKNPVELNWHKHEHEQITIVNEGELKVEFNNTIKVMKAGDAVIIPGNVMHKADITKTPFRSYDIFSPVRQDFIDNISVITNDRLE